MATRSKYSPIILDDEWFIGGHRVFEFQVWNDDDTSHPDISSWELEWMLRQSPASDIVFIEKTTSAGISITDGVNGVFQVTVEAEDTLLITPGEGEYWHSAKRTDANAEDILVYGEAAIRYAATR